MLEVGQSMHGFAVTGIRSLPDCHGTLYEMKHLRTGALLCWLMREDDNKTFSITFRTVPSDHTGVFHILEHSVLNGSDRYPVREPFVELLKSSMNTFLNAMTFSDKTMFPVSSRNTKDFMNLVSVYLDAVFHPSIYQNRHIFEQEGWHYEIRSEADEPVYKGVVFNEMKGAMSSVDDTVIDQTCRALFPDTCYRFNSGGDPRHIPELSYGKFLETHRTFYHPSNARIWLDGDMEITEVLALIDSFIGTYERQDAVFPIPMQEVLPSATTEYEYEIPSAEPLAGRTIISYAKIMTSFDEPEKNLAMNVIASILTGSNDAPLKKALLQENLCEDVELALIDGIQQPFCICLLRNTEKEHEPRIRKVIEETVLRLAGEGLSSEDLTATINQMEFRYRERSEPAGIINAEESLESWLYSDDPALYLNLSGVYASLRNRIGTGYFEDLMKEFFLDTAHLQTIIALPSHDLGSRMMKEEAEHLRQAKASWGDGISGIIAENRSLDQWQAEPDSPEALAALPHLNLSDVEKNPKPDAWSQTEYRHVPLLLHPAEDSGITYMNLYFSLAGIPADMLSSLSFYVSLLGDLPTESHTVQELQREIKKTIGSLGISVTCFTPVGNAEKTTPVIAVRCAALKENLHAAAALIIEILQKTVFRSEDVIPLLRQTLTMYRQSLSDNGHAFASLRTASHLSAEGVFKEYTSGFEKFIWLQNLEQSAESSLPMFLNDCTIFQDNLYTGSRLTASVTGAENIPVLKEIIDTIPFGDASRAMVHYPLLPGNREAIVIPNSVGYAALAGDTGCCDASMHVVMHLLTYDWLWSEVRVKGGAYGAKAGVSSSGIMNAYSYRDPDPAGMLSAVRAIPQILRNLTPETAVDQYVIGAIAAGNPLLSPSGKIALSDTRYFCGITYRQRCENRLKMLQTTLETIHDSAAQLQNAVETAAVCVAAPKEMLDSLSNENLTVLSPK